MLSSTGARLAGLLDSRQGHWTLVRLRHLRSSFPLVSPSLQVIDEVSDLIGLKYLAGLQPQEKTAAPVAKPGQETQQRKLMSKNKVLGSLLTVVSSAKLAVAWASKASWLF